jgi:hypothetical protein
MNRTLARFSLCFAPLLIGPVAAAIPVPGLDVAGLVARADIVAAGRVGAVVDHGEAFVDTPSGRRVLARSMTGELLVDYMLKGPVDVSAVQLRFVVPDEFLGYGGVTPGSYRVFFLKRKEDSYEFVSVHHPSVIAAPRAHTMHRSALDRVAAAVAAVLRSLEMSRDQKREAMFVLSDTGGPVSVSALRSSLEEQDQTLRLSAAAALLMLGDVSALPVAEEVLLHPDKNLSPELLHNLRAGIRLGVRDVATVPTLARLLSAVDREARRAAVEALRNTKAPAAIAALAEALEDDNADVRYVATIGLAEITGQDEWRPGPDEFAQDDARYLSHWRDWARRQLSEDRKELVPSRQQE